MVDWDDMWKHEGFLGDEKESDLLEKAIHESCFRDTSYQDSFVILEAIMETRDFKQCETLARKGLRELPSEYHLMIRDRLASALYCLGEKEEAELIARENIEIHKTSYPGTYALFSLCLFNKVREGPLISFRHGNYIVADKPLSKLEEAFDYVHKAADLGHISTLFLSKYYNYVYLVAVDAKIELENKSRSIEGFEKELKQLKKIINEDADEQVKDKREADMIYLTGAIEHYSKLGPLTPDEIKSLSKVYKWAIKNLTKLHADFLKQGKNVPKVYYTSIKGYNSMDGRFGTVVLREVDQRL
jgi:tetratricopeptide (TPR) repeat protein